MTYPCQRTVLLRRKGMIAALIVIAMLVLPWGGEVVGGQKRESPNPHEICYKGRYDCDATKLKNSCATYLYMKGMKANVIAIGDSDIRNFYADSTGCNAPIACTAVIIARAYPEPGEHRAISLSVFKNFDNGIVSEDNAIKVINEVPFQRACVAAKNCWKNREQRDVRSCLTEKQALDEHVPNPSDNLDGPAGAVETGKTASEAFAPNGAIPAPEARLHVPYVDKPVRANGADAAGVQRKGNDILPSQAAPETPPTAAPDAKPAVQPVGEPHVPVQSDQSFRPHGDDASSLSGRADTRGDYFIPWAVFGGVFAVTAAIIWASRSQRQLEAFTSAQATGRLQRTPSGQPRVVPNLSDVLHRAVSLRKQLIELVQDPPTRLDHLGFPPVDRINLILQSCAELVQSLKQRLEIALPPHLWQDVQATGHEPLYEHFRSTNFLPLYATPREPDPEIERMHRINQQLNSDIEALKGERAHLDLQLATTNAERDKLEQEVWRLQKNNCTLRDEKAQALAEAESAREWARQAEDAGEKRRAAAELFLTKARELRNSYASGLPAFLTETSIGETGDAETLMDFLTESAANAPKAVQRLEVALRSFVSAREDGGGEQEMLSRLHEAGERLFDLYRQLNLNIDEQSNAADLWVKAINSEPAAKGRYSVFVPFVGKAFDGSEMSGPVTPIRTVERVRGWGVRNAKRIIARKSYVE